MAEFNFVPFSTTYESKNALLLAQASNLAYKTGLELESGLSELGFDQYEMFDDHETETQCFVASNDICILTSFRGTESFQDTKEDLNLRLVSFEHGRGKVHKGFQEGLNSVYDKVCKQIKNYQEQTEEGTPITKKEKSLWFTGHSLGAALATLTVARLTLESDRAVTGLYTFGSPRVGNREFEKAFNDHFKKCHFRFVHHSDSVARLPLHLMGYRHVDNAVYIDENNKVYHDRAQLWQVIDALRDYILHTFSMLKFDHKLATYIAALQANID